MTETIEELAKQKAELDLTLQAIAQTNVAGRTVADLTELELHRIKTLKAMREVQAKIDDYIKAA